MCATSNQPRRGYASADSERRMLKAQKIEALLSTLCPVDGARVLEVGTGAGYIAAHFAQRVGPRGQVQAVDVTDTRKVHQGYQFQRVDDTTLPFDHATFDICISNHVLEHVGDGRDQLQHLREIRRVLRPNGWLYLAVPNRWTLMEPHFRLPLLSWFPPKLGDLYVRAAGKGERYDCDPPSSNTLRALLKQANLSAKDVTLDGIRLVGELESKPGLRRQALCHPGLWAWAMYGILPSYLILSQPSPKS